ncbi:MAG: hypothetical protein JWN60_794 [Acidobacteria bacterium]|jgi:hypothetical protein|nr:hypothetical protein [Acidobacteriota bacterium]
MLYIEIPYIDENNRIDRTSAQNEIQMLEISDEEKANVFDAIYHRKPNGVGFDSKDLKEVMLLETALLRLGVPFRRIKE